MLIPARLAAFKNAIQVIDPDAQSIQYNRDLWRYSTKGTPLFHRDADFDLIAQRFPEQISRDDLRTLSIEAHTDNALSRALFLATMIWGYGKKGYGPYRVRRILNSPITLSMLNMALAEISKGRVVQVYRSFNLPGCGASFSTKFFYSVGLGSAVEPRPLVLDRLVRASWEILAADGVVTRLGKSADEYARYVQLVNRWAQDLDCRPDSIEMFLWKPPCDFSRMVIG